MDWQGQDLWDYLEVVTNFPPDAGAYLQYHKLSFKRENGKLVSVFINNQPLDVNGTYRMSINSYNASGGDGYPILLNRKGYISTDETDSNALKRFFMENSPVKASEFTPQ